MYHEICHYWGGAIYKSQVYMHSVYVCVCVHSKHTYTYIYISTHTTTEPHCTYNHHNKAPSQHTLPTKTLQKEQ
ncbi:hypothetical protein EON63_11365 [archaeon]|nr:MAG: hypothetical protein EON63_11365 [archaeon]